MKKLIFLFLFLFSLQLSAQVIKKDYFLFGQQLPMQLSSDRSCVIAISRVKPDSNFGNFNYIYLTYFAVNSALDTNKILLRTPTNANFSSYLGSFKNFYYFTRQNVNNAFPSQFVPFEEAGIIKLDKSGRRIWEKDISPIGVGGFEYLGITYDSYIDSNANLFFTGMRSYIVGGNTVEHPYLMMLDSSGLVLGELDFLSNKYTTPQQIIPLDSGKMVVICNEFSNDSTFAIAYTCNTNNMQLISKKYLNHIGKATIYDQSTNRISATYGPNNQVFVYSYYEPHFWVGFRKFINFSEMRQGLTGQAIWNRGHFSNPIVYASFLKSGELFIQEWADSGMYFNKYNPANGSLVSSTFSSFNGWYNGFIMPFVRAEIDSIGDLYSMVYLSANTIGRKTQLYCLPNVGQVWRPWNSVTSTAKLLALNKLHAYPNPTTGRLRLRGLKETEGVSLRLFNNQGQEVWKGSPSTEGEIDISNFPIGLYHLEALNAQGQRWFSRVVRE